LLPVTPHQITLKYILKLKQCIKDLKGDHILEISMAKGPDESVTNVQNVSGANNLQMFESDIIQYNDQFFQQDEKLELYIKLPAFMHTQVFLVRD